MINKQRGWSVSSAFTYAQAADYLSTDRQNNWAKWRCVLKADDAQGVLPPFQLYPCGSTESYQTATVKSYVCGEDTNITLVRGTEDDDVDGLYRQVSENLWVKSGAQIERRGNQWSIEKVRFDGNLLRLILSNTAIR